MGYYEKTIDVPGMPEGLFLIEFEPHATSGLLRVIVSNPNGGSGLAQRYQTENDWTLRYETFAADARRILAAIDAIEAANIPWGKRESL